MNPEISVVVPLYRTADSLRELHRRTVLALAGREFELVLVDDACPEGSGAAASGLAAEDDRVVALLLPENGGQHAAVLRGLAAGRGAWSVIIDGDLQDPPEAIPGLVDAGLAAGVPVVFAGRRGRYESLGRTVTGRLYRRTLSLVAGVPADAGIAMALDRSVVERLVAMKGRSRPSLVAMVGCLRVPMISIPVERVPRPSGASAHGPFDRLRAGFRALAWALVWRLRGAR
jgi:polyisoprenyl-phosphate glycosyltransferase